MKFIKLFFLLVLMGGVGAGTYFWKTKKIASLADLKAENLQPIAAQGIAAANQYIPQAEKFTQVLGAQTESNQSTSGANISLPGKAIETARYMYCQQVIKDYESRFGKNEATPKP
jgi:hypothetical protein